MANYLVTDLELESIADAIREKGGTSAELEFPSEFIDAIEAIETGGSAIGLKEVDMTYTPASDVTYFAFDNPLYPLIPKLVVAYLDTESYEGETVNMVHSCQFCTEEPFYAATYQNFKRYAGAYRYYNASGVICETCHGKAASAGNAPGVGVGANAGKLQTYGYGNTYKYKAGATYIIKLFYWGDGDAETIDIWQGGSY